MAHPFVFCRIGYLYGSSPPPTQLGGVVFAQLLFSTKYDPWWSTYIYLASVVVHLIIAMQIYCLFVHQIWAKAITQVFQKIHGLLMEIFYSRIAIVVPLMLPQKIRFIWWKFDQSTTRSLLVYIPSNVPFTWCSWTTCILSFYTSLQWQS